MALGSITSTMDASITSISFPILTKVFNTELTTVMWVALAYTLVSTSLLLILGKISDLIGRKKIYITGITIFTLSLVACSLSQSIRQLIIFRMLQAVGGGMILACGTAIVVEAFPSRELGKGLGLHGISVSLGFIIGPILGGFLLSWLDWRSIFYVRVPVGLIALFMALFLLKKDRIRTQKIELDLIGTLTSSVGLACIIFGVSQIDRFGIKSSFVHLLLGLGLLILIGFIFLERRVKAPIVDLSLFKDRTFSFAILSLFLVSITYPAQMMIMPFYLMQGIGLTSSATGLLMAVTSIIIIVVGPISGWLSDRFGPIWYSTFGAGASAAALYFMLGLDLDTTSIYIISIQALMGLGIGVFQPPNNSTIMGVVSHDRLGTSSALIALHRHVGIMLGMAITGTIYSVRKAFYQAEFTQQGLKIGYAAKLSIPLAFQDVLYIAIFIGAFAVLFSIAPLKLKIGNG